MTYLLASQGLNEYERGLVYEQLRIIHGRTNSEWSYIGEVDALDADNEANMIITRSFTELPEWVLQAVLLADGQLPTQRAENLLYGEWPLRIVGLMELLRQAERQLADHPSFKSPSRDQSLQLPSQLFSSLAEHIQPSQALVLDLNGEKAHIFIDETSQCRVQANPTPGDLIPMLLELHPSQIDFKMTDFQQVEQGSSVPLNQFLWQLALQEPILHQPEWNQDNHSYHIQRWPMLGMWHTEPHMFHLAALFGRTFETLSNAASAANVPKHLVASYLHACRSVGLGVERKEHQPRSVQEHHQKEETHFFSALREKLGLVFKS